MFFAIGHIFWLRKRVPTVKILVLAARGDQSQENMIPFGNFEFINNVFILGHDICG